MRQIFAESGLKVNRRVAMQTDVLTTISFYKPAYTSRVIVTTSSIGD